MKNFFISLFLMACLIVPCISFGADNLVQVYEDQYMTVSYNKTQSSFVDIDVIAVKFDTIFKPNGMFSSEGLLRSEEVVYVFNINSLYCHGSETFFFIDGSTYTNYNISYLNTCTKRFINSDGLWLDKILPLIQRAPDGDLNGDGIINIIDALTVLRVVVGIIPVTVDMRLHGDVAPIVGTMSDPDGKIDLIDALMILRKTIGLQSWWY